MGFEERVEGQARLNLVTCQSSVNRVSTNFPPFLIHTIPYTLMDTKLGTCHGSLLGSADGIRVGIRDGLVLGDEKHINQ